MLLILQLKFGDSEVVNFKSFTWVQVHQYKCNLDHTTSCFSVTEEFSTSHSTLISNENLNSDLFSYKMRFSACQVARNLGKTLREFQPTIRELQVGPCDICLSFFVSFISEAGFDSHGALVFCMKEVSRDFKSTLEREIGLDDIKGSGQDTIKSSTTLRQEVDPSESLYLLIFPLCFPKLVYFYFYNLQTGFNFLDVLIIISTA